MLFLVSVIEEIDNCGCGRNHPQPVYEEMDLAMAFIDPRAGVRYQAEKGLTAYQAFDLYLEENKQAQLNMMKSFTGRFR